MNQPSTRIHEFVDFVTAAARRAPPIIDRQRTGAQAGPTMLLDRGVLSESLITDHKRGPAPIVLMSKRP